MPTNIRYLNGSVVSIHPCRQHLRRRLNLFLVGTLAQRLRKHSSVQTLRAANTFDSQNSRGDVDVPGRGSNHHAALEVRTPKDQCVAHQPWAHAAMTACCTGKRTRLAAAVGVVLTRHAKRIRRRAPRQGEQDIRASLGVLLPNQPERERSRNPSEIIPDHPTGRSSRCSTGSEDYIDPILFLQESYDALDSLRISTFDVYQHRLPVGRQYNVIRVGAGLESRVE